MRNKLILDKYWKGYEYMIDIYEVLNKLNIEYQMVEHEEVVTAEQSKHIKNMIEGVGGKTLFLKDKNNYYLYLLDDERQANLKFLSKSLNIGRLSFGNEDELYDKLKLKKGSVTPLGIINDNSSVILIIDKTLKGKKILTHPNINTATVSIRYDDLIKFIKYCNNTYYEV